MCDSSGKTQAQVQQDFGLATKYSQIITRSSLNSCVFWCCYLCYNTDNGMERALGKLANDRKLEQAADMLHSMVSRQLE